MSVGIVTLESAPKPVLIPYTTSPLDIIFSTRFLEFLIVEIEELDNLTLVLKFDTEITCSIVKEFPSSTISALFILHLRISFQVNSSILYWAQ